MTPIHVSRTQAHAEAVEALRVLVEHFCYSFEGVSSVAAEAWNEWNAEQAANPPCMCKSYHRRTGQHASGCPRA